uniref:Reverse transcriptase n=1 Tax=Triatoma infestans TaxID=30076 RepID=A0A161M257_TRIIF
MGPDLWNVAYDGLLRQEMLEETVLVGYADDVAALIAARDLPEAQRKLNSVMRTVNR